MNILLLEDNMSLNKAIAKILHLDDHTVHAYHDGQAALNACDRVYDLYIFDINVPTISGLELLELVSHQNSHAKVIVISSNTDLSTLQTAYKLGCLDYLKKPFHLEELRIKVNRLDIGSRSHDLGVRLKDAVTGLTKKEKTLLDLLLEHRGSVVRYELIDTCVYGEKTMTMDGLRALVRRLRAKLADDIIQNVIDEGYCCRV